MTPSTKRPTEAWHSSNIFEIGFGEVLIARFKASGEVEVGVFLVDVYCLGVKNAFLSVGQSTDFEADNAADEEPPEPNQPGGSERN